MLFRRRHIQETELKIRGEAYLVRTNVGGATALPPTPFSPDDPSNWEPPTAEAPKGQSDLASAPTELGVWYRQAKQFKPVQRRLARSRVIGGEASSKVHSAYNVLRTQIIKRLQEHGWNTVAITSPSKASGNTLTAINLAISIARHLNYTVLLVELDLVNPSFRKILGFEQRQGIVDHLLHGVPIPEILLNPGIERLFVLPAGSPVTNSSELLSGSKMARLVEKLKCPYENQIVLFDLPSVLANDDAMAFCAFVDCALLVVEEGETRVNAVRRALEYLRSTEIIGVVLNRSIQS
jgi:protein-tyrosine kinase